MFVIKRDGTKEPLDIEKIHRAAEWACKGLRVSLSDLEASAHIQFQDNITTESIQTALIKSAADKISEAEPDWSYVAARLLLQRIYKLANNGNISYPPLSMFLETMVEDGKLDESVLSFDLEYLDSVIQKDRDLQFHYLGLQTLFDRYFLRDSNNNIRELPQHFFMRVAMGVAIDEKTDKLRNEWAVKYYEQLSTFAAMASSPTLFNSATLFPQLSSCFVISMDDGLEDIMGALTEAAQYSKFSGGIGMDISRVRSSGSLIRSTGGRAGGVIPYAKIYNDVLLGFDQGGKRLGAGALYLETWHADIEEFLELKNSSGEERRRAHDIFPALWHSDLFMERVKNDAEWSLFSPSTVPLLTETYGEEFRKHYLQAEKDGLAVKTVRAKDLFRKTISKLFETGTYWPCFKDRVNERYQQKDSGIVRSSNLCTEILLRTSNEISAVCNLGSINLSKVDINNPFESLRNPVRTMVRFLDSVVSIGLIPHKNGRHFNEEDRAIGLGVMGYTELLVMMGIEFESNQHLAFANTLFEHFSYYAIEASADLAKEKGVYRSFSKSEWAKGILPIDTVHPEHLKKLGMENPCSLDWGKLREKVKEGMRNSCLMAIAPTATISNIVNTTQSIELPYQLVYAKGNLSGSFQVVSPTLLHGRRDLCKNAFEVDQLWSVKACAVRQFWIDQGQSQNIYAYEDVSGKELTRIYTNAWEYGLKTTYYLRSQAPEIKACAVMDDGCLSCQ